MDFRSLIIGLLGGLCIFLMMGQNRGNMGDITVSSIAIMDEENQVAWFGASTKGGGMMELYNPHEVRSVVIASSEGSGYVSTYNQRGQETTNLATAVEGFGYLRTYNNYSNVSSYIGASVSEEGMIVLYDKYGNYIWGQ